MDIISGGYVINNQFNFIDHSFNKQSCKFKNNINIINYDAKFVFLTFIDFLYCIHPIQLFYHLSYA